MKKDRGASGGVLRNFFSPEHAKNGPPNLLREIGTMVGVPASVSAGQASESSLTVTLTRGPRTQRLSIQPGATRHSNRSYWAVHYARTT